MSKIHIKYMTDEALDYLEAQNFKDSLDLILFLEG
jgi:hypothetical protein